MRAAERKRFAAAWLRKYGVTIDERRSSLRVFGFPSTAAQGRRGRAARALSPLLLKEIRRSRYRTRDILYRVHTSGTATTYREFEMQWRQSCGDMVTVPKVPNRMGFDAHSRDGCGLAVASSKSYGRPSARYL